MKMSVKSLTYQQRVFKRYHSGKHFSEFYPQDGGENKLAQTWIEITSPSLYVCPPQSWCSVETDERIELDFGIRELPLCQLSSAR